MVSYISIIIACLITFPIPFTWIVYKIGNKVVRQKSRALHIAVNWTTILYILSTIMMLNIIFEQHFIGIIFGLILSILALIIIWQWKTRTEILFSKAVKILWRLCFIIFLVTYIILAFYGIAMKMFF